MKGEIFRLRCHGIMVVLDQFYEFATTDAKEFAECLIDQEEDDTCYDTNAFILQDFTARITQFRKDHLSEEEVPDDNYHPFDIPEIRERALSKQEVCKKLAEIIAPRLEEFVSELEKRIPELATGMFNANKSVETVGHFQLIFERLKSFPCSPKTTPVTFVEHVNEVLHTHYNRSTVKRLQELIVIASYEQQLNSGCQNTTPEVTIDKSEQITEPVSLTGDQVDLLNWFDERHPQITYVAHYSKRSDQTNRKNVKCLEEAGLIERTGKRGRKITPLGQKYIEEHF